MAINTAERRFSIINLTLPWRGINEYPDAGTGSDEREALLYQYSGIAPAAPAIDTGLPLRFGRRRPNTGRKY
jgi:hypothetical protein